ncbi:MAG: hypothetical protein ABIR03_00940 [Ginsengibacter sp.]
MRYCFYSVYQNIKGGYTTLLLTLIKELNRQKYEVVLFNFLDGLIVRELEKEGIKINVIDLKTVDWKEIDQHIFPTDIFIVPKFIEEFRHLFKVNPRVIYYDINDFICRISDYKFGIRLPSLGKKLIQKMIASKSLLFMDDTGVFNLKNEFSLNVEKPQLLPIPIAVCNQNKYSGRASLSSEQIKLTYIGRSVIWKMNPLKKILKDCVNLNIKKKIIFSIVVDDLKNFREFIKLENFIKNEYLSINVIENIPPSRIEDFLLQKSDIHFAMGTAALEAARLGIPTILVDYSSKEFNKNYSYNWLYNTVNYSLGRNLEKIPARTGVSLENLIGEFFRSPEKMKIESQKSYQYAMDNHSVSEIVSQLTTICEQATFRLNDARPYIPYYFKFHLFSKKIFKLKIKQGII